MSHKDNHFLKPDLVKFINLTKRELPKPAILQVPKPPEPPYDRYIDRTPEFDYALWGIIGGVFAVVGFIVYMCTCHQ